MKKFVLVTLVLWFLFAGVFATEDSDEFDIIDQYARMYGDAVADSVGELKESDLYKLVPDFDVGETVLQGAKGNLTFSAEDILDRAVGLLWGELKSVLKVLVFVPVIAVLCAYLNNMQKSFSVEGAAKAAFYVCYIVVAGILSASLIQTVECAKKMIDGVSVFMRVILPLILAAMMGGGSVASASAFEMVLLGIIQTTQWLVEYLFIPLIMMTAALNMVNNMSEGLNSQKLVQFMNKAVKWGIGIAMTIFVGVMGMQGIVSGNADIISVRLTKFATSNLVPVVGGALAETVETVMKCSTVIKNSLGITGIIVIVLIGALPIIKVGACLVAFRLCAALAEPITDSRITKCISQLGDTISCVLGLMWAVAVMFVIVLTIMINMGGAA